MKIELDFKPISEYNIGGGVRAFLVIETGDLYIGYESCSTFHQSPTGHRIYPIYFAPMVSIDPRDFEIAALKKEIEELKSRLYPKINLSPMLQPGLNNEEFAEVLNRTPRTRSDIEHQIYLDNLKKEFDED